MPRRPNDPTIAIGAEPPVAASTSFATCVLLATSEQRKGADAACSRSALLHVETARLVHRRLQRALARHQLTDLQFAILVILFSTDPDSITGSALAEHAAVSAAAISGAADKLEARGLALRVRDDFDLRIVHLRITASGRDLVDAAISDYLRTAADAARQVHSTARPQILSTVARIHERGVRAQIQFGAGRATSCSEVALGRDRRKCA